MADDLEEGPDPNDLRRHAKKLYTEQQYRQKYHRLDFYKPNRAQLAFHNLIMRERMLRAGNQLGKSTAGAAELAMHMTQLYAPWHEGRKFLVKPPIERPYDFLAWIAAPTSVKVRDGMQSRLFGDISRSDGLGTGLIPLDHIIGRPSLARGVADFIDSAAVRRADGGTAVLRNKTYDQDRQAYEGEPCDVIALDEDIKGEFNGAIYTECLARLTTTRGIIMVTMTPRLGPTNIRRRFKEKTEGTAEIVMTLDDALVSNGGHIPDEEVPDLLRKYPAHERATRLYGADMQGEGAVFETPVEQIKQQFDWREFPPHFRWLWSLDFRHSGNASGGHPFAAVLAAHDTEADVIYIAEAFKMHGLPESHVARIKSHRWWRAPTICPHDVGRAASLLSGETIGAVYKKLGLHILAGHATFPDGSYNFEAGITEMESRFAQGRLVVASHLHAFFDEYQGYHRVNGIVNKIDDDILSATRLICIAIRHAKPPERFEGFGANPLARDPRTRFAKGSMNHPDGSYDLFRV